MERLPTLSSMTPSEHTPSAHPLVPAAGDGGSPSEPPPRRSRRPAEAVARGAEVVPVALAPPPLGAPGEVRTVRLTDLDCSAALQVRGRRDPDRVSMFEEIYAEDPSALPPISVVAGDAGLFVDDGLHRLAAMQGLEWKEAEAVVHQAPRSVAVDDYTHLRAVVAATRGPLGLSRRQRTEQAVWIRAHFGLKTTQIAELVGFSREGLSRIFTRLDNPAAVPPPPDPARFARALLVAWDRLRVDPDPWSHLALAAHAAYGPAAIDVLQHLYGNVFCAREGLLDPELCDLELPPADDGHEGATR